VGGWAKGRPTAPGSAKTSEIANVKITVPTPDFYKGRKEGGSTLVVFLGKSKRETTTSRGFLFKRCGKGVRP